LTPPPLPPNAKTSSSYTPSRYSTADDLIEENKRLMEELDESTLIQAELYSTVQDLKTELDVCF
jgi:hypothetical protein